MSITRHNLSVIIVSFKSDYVIENCIKSIDKEIEIIIIENSNNYDFKNKIESKYKNVKCILSEENLGMGAGNNLGIEYSDKEYVFILNPDTCLESNSLDEIINASKNIENFALIAPISNKDKYPNYTLKKDITFDPTNPFQVNSIDGYAMLLNLRRLKRLYNFRIFDENFFLYLENDDLCKRLIDIKENIYIVPKAKIDHQGGQAVDPKFKDEIELSRNWHWMWSKFYYNKKHYGYLFALLKTSKNLIISKIKFLYYWITFNEYKKKIYQMRISGLINSMLGKRSFYRPKI